MQGHAKDTLLNSQSQRKNHRGLESTWRQRKGKPTEIANAAPIGIGTSTARNACVQMEGSQDNRSQETKRNVLKPKHDVTIPGRVCSCPDAHSTEQVPKPGSGMGRNALEQSQGFFLLWSFTKFLLRATWDLVVYPKSLKELLKQ